MTHSDQLWQLRVTTFTLITLTLNNFEVQWSLPSHSHQLTPHHHNHPHLMFTWLRPMSHADCIKPNVNLPWYVKSPHLFLYWPNIVFPFMNICIFASLLPPTFIPLHLCYPWPFVPIMSLLSPFHSHVSLVYISCPTPVYLDILFIELGYLLLSSPRPPDSKSPPNSDSDPTPEP